MGWSGVWTAIGRVIKGSGWSGDGLAIGRVTRRGPVWEMCWLLEVIEGGGGLVGRWAGSWKIN